MVLITKLVVSDCWSYLGPKKNKTFFFHREANWLLASYLLLLLPVIVSTVGGILLRSKEPHSC